MMIPTAMSTVVLASTLAALPANAATQVAADGSNHLGVARATSNLTFLATGEPGTVGRAAAIGLPATIVGNASRTKLTSSGTTDSGVLAGGPFLDRGA